MKAAILAGLFLMFLAACSSQSETERFIESNPETYRLGQQVYSQNCASCHGASGEGQFPDEPRARDSSGRYGAPPHNENGHTWHHADDLLYQIVREGGMGNPEDFNLMPAFGERLSNEDIEAVVFYIKSFWTEEQRQWQQQVTDSAQNQ
jgi:mono/diheme cytochrome c family protein